MGWLFSSPFVANKTTVKSYIRTRQNHPTLPIDVTNKEDETQIVLKAFDENLLSEGLVLVKLSDLNSLHETSKHFQLSNNQSSTNMLQQQNNSNQTTQSLIHSTANNLVEYLKHFDHCFNKLNNNSEIMTMITAQDKIASLESICNELITLRETARTQQEELTKLSESKNAVSEQLSGLLKTKERSEELLLKGHVLNTSTEQIVDRIVKEVGSIQNDILDLLISIENLDDDQAKNLDKCLGMSLCQAFTKTSYLSTALDLAGKKFDELIMANSLNVIISEQVYRQLASFLKTMVERMHKISNLGSNIKFHWFEITNELKDMKIEYSITIGGQGAELERVEYYCLFPPLYVGETLQLEGKVFQVKYNR